MKSFLGCQIEDLLQSIDEDREYILGHVICALLEKEEDFFPGKWRQSVKISGGKCVIGIIKL